MRKVIVYTTVQHEKELYRGVFHQFGINFVEFETGPGNYTTVIVEKEDGTLDQTEIPYVKFIDPIKTS